MRNHTIFVRGRRTVFSLLVVGFMVLAVPPAPSALTWDTPASETAELIDLSHLVAPIALYPDDLLALMLPAATFPIQVVQASRFLANREHDEQLQPDPLWDASILALLNYPEALALLNEDLDWTWQLGEAVVEDQGAVMQAVQGFRQRVLAAGNLESNEYHSISQQDDAILIVPADPEILYVPSYRPSSVVVVHTGEPLYWYSTAYPYYYHPRAAYWSGFYFGTAGFVYGLSWGGYGTYSRHDGHHGHHVTVHHKGHERPGDGHHSGRGNVWKPEPHRKMHGSRPGRFTQSDRSTGSDGSARSNRGGERTAPAGVRSTKPFAGTGRGRGFSQSSERQSPRRRFTTRNESSTRKVASERTSRDSTRGSRPRKTARASVERSRYTGVSTARASSKRSAPTSTKKSKLGSLGIRGKRDSGKRSAVSSSTTSLYRAMRGASNRRGSSSAKKQSPRVSKAPKGLKTFKARKTSSGRLKMASSSKRVSGFSSKGGTSSRKSRGQGSKSSRRSSGRRGAKR